MCRRLIPSPIKYLLTVSYLGLHTMLLSTSVLLLLFIRMMMPIPSFRRGLMHFCNEFPRFWGSGAICFNRWITGVEIDIRGVEDLNRQQWSALISNHRSFADILILHYALDAHLAPLRFFMKNSLKFFPFIGLVCIALGYPFMRRYSKSKIAKKPWLKGRDLETTRRACERYRQMPITVISFVEGTRYTTQKAKRQKSPFQFLLKPKAGGIAFTLNAMQDCLQKLVLVDLVYSGDKDPSFSRFFAGKIDRVVVNVQAIDIPKEIVGDYANDRDFRVVFQQWLNQEWQEKDRRIAAIKRELNG